MRNRFSMLKSHARSVIIAVVLIAGIAQLHRRHRFGDLSARFDFPSQSIDVPHDLWAFSFQKMDSAYEIVMDYNISKVDTYRWSVTESCVLEFGRPNVSLSQEDLENLEDNLWYRPISRRVFLAYPQSIDLNETVSRLIRRRPITEVNR